MIFNISSSFFIGINIIEIIRINPKVKIGNISMLDFKISFIFIIFCEYTVTPFHQKGQEDDDKILTHILIL